MRFLISSLLLSGAHAAVDAPGDCVFIGMNMDTPDDFAVLLLDSMASGETLFVTENGVLSDGTTLRGTGEGTKYYTASGTVAAGTVLTLADFAGESFGLSASGDQLLAYTSTAATSAQTTTSQKTFVCALDLKGGWITSGTPESTESYLPTGLTEGTTALAMTSHVDNAFYSGTTRSGTASVLAAAINTASSWTTSNSAPVTFLTASDFSVTLPVTATWAGAAGGTLTGNWSEWPNWDGGNLGTVDYIVIAGSSVVTVALPHYSHAGKLTCSASARLKVMDKLCIGPACVSSEYTQAAGDPHITFANGGKADFRGKHRRHFAFITSPGYQFAPYFQEVDFWYFAPTGAKQLVHGTFMTKAAWRIRTSMGRELLIKADAMKKGMLDVLVVPSLADSLALDAPDLASLALTVKPWQRIAFDDVKIETYMLTATVETAEWSVNVTAKPIYGLVQPMINETHVHGHWAEDQKRLDLVIKGSFPQPDAHGIVGQSYRDSEVRHGKLDDYGIDEAGATKRMADVANGEGMMPPLTTSAQAEGAIDGVYTDYELDSPFATSFAYSRYLSTRSSALSGGTLSKRTAKTADYDGNADEWAQRGKHEL